MLELFFKHLDYIAPELTNRKHSAHITRVYLFEDAIVDKHWKSFYAIYKKGRTDALNDIGVYCVQQINGK